MRVTEPSLATPGALPIRDEVHEVAGGRVHVQWRGPEAGPVTVVLHGGGPGCHPASDFAAILDRLPAWRFLLVDLPGYGLSGPLADPGPMFSTHAAVLGRLLDRLGVHRADVLAQSLGGGVALKLAADRPGVVGRIVLIGSQPIPAPAGTAVDPGLGARVREEYYGGDGPNLAAMRRLMSSLEWRDPADLPDALVRARHEASVTETALQTARDASLRGSPEDLTGVLAAVTVPVLVLWGRHDPFAGPDYAAALAAGLPEADLMVLSGTAHHPQSERPEVVAALIEAHLRSGLHPAPVPRNAPSSSEGVLSS